MTVAQWIAKLSTMPQDTEVYIAMGYGELTLLEGTAWEGEAVVVETIVGGIDDGFEVLEEYRDDMPHQQGKPRKTVVFVG